MTTPKTMPDAPSTVAAWLLLFCFVPGSLAAALALPDLPNKVQTKEIARLEAEKTACPAGTRITIIEAGKKTCLTEHVNGYGRANQRHYVAQIKGIEK